MQKNKKIKSFSLNKDSIELLEDEKTKRSAKSTSRVVDSILSEYKEIKSKWEEVEKIIKK